MTQRKTTGEISYLLRLDEPEPSYVECTYTIRYAVTPYRENCRDVLDVEVLDVSLESAVAWIGDAGVDVPVGFKPFEINAVQRFNEWHDKAIRSVGKNAIYPNRDEIEMLVLEDYETADLISREAWA